MPQRLADRCTATTSCSFSRKHFHSAGAFAVRSGRLGSHWFWSFLVERGFAQVEVDRLLQLEQKGSQGLVARVQAIAYRRAVGHSFLVRLSSLGLMMDMFHVGCSRLGGLVHR